MNGNGSGNITVNATGDISLVGGTGGVPFGYTQIGNGGQQFNGAANGNINVTTSGSLTLAAGDQGNYAQIGNGQVDTGSNSASGDVAVNVTGQTALFASEDEQVWIGNVGGAGESGNVTLITGTATGSIDATAMAIAELAGGNFTLGLTGDSDFAIAGIADYNSTHALTILNAGSLEVTGEILNSGTGDINLVAGWNPIRCSICGANHARRLWQQWRQYYDRRRGCDVSCGNRQLWRHDNASFRHRDRRCGKWRYPAWLSWRRRRKYRGDRDR